MSADWELRAACRGQGIALFFAPEGEKQAAAAVRVEAAKAVCKGCKVRTACLEFALAKPHKEGVWGGQDEKERAAERRRRQRRAQNAGAA